MNDNWQLVFKHFTRSWLKSSGLLVLSSLAVAPFSIFSISATPPQGGCGVDQGLTDRSVFLAGHAFQLKIEKLILNSDLKTLKMHDIVEGPDFIMGELQCSWAGLRRSMPTLFVFLFISRLKCLLKRTTT